MYILLLISGLYSIVFGLIMNTNDIYSALMFKVMPFLFGLVQLFIAAKNFGWIS